MTVKEPVLLASIYTIYTQSLINRKENKKKCHRVAKRSIDDIGCSRIGSEDLLLDPTFLFTHSSTQFRKPFTSTKSFFLAWDESEWGIGGRG